MIFAQLLTEVEATYVFCITMTIGAGFVAFDFIRSYIVNRQAFRQNMGITQTPHQMMVDEFRRNAEYHERQRIEHKLSDEMDRLDKKIKSCNTTQNVQELRKLILDQNFDKSHN